MDVRPPVPGPPQGTGPAVKAEVIPAVPEVLEGQVIPPRPVPLRVIGTAARHPGVRAAGRHLMYVPAGAAVVTARLWDSRTAGRYERGCAPPKRQGTWIRCSPWRSGSPGSAGTGTNAAPT